MATAPPKLNLAIKPRFTIPLVGPVGAGPGLGLTLIGGPITFPYRIAGAEVVFRDDTNNLLRVYLLVSRDRTTSNGLPPADSNLLSPYTGTAYLVGEALIKRVALSYEPDSDQQYLKAHVINDCPYPQIVNVTIEIEAV